MFIMNKGFKRSLAFGLTVVFFWQQTGFSDQIKTDGKTQTRLEMNGHTTDIFTDSVQGANAYNSFSKFDVYANNVVNLYFPTGAENLLNFVHDQASRIDGILNSIKDGKVGGNVYLMNPHGITVGAAGTVNVGSLTMSTPDKSFMENAFSGSGLLTAPAAAAVLEGTMPINKDATILIDGEINAINDVKINAGNVDLSGSIKSHAIFVPSTSNFDDVVNVNDIEHASEVIFHDNGDIEIISSNVEIMAEDTAILRGTAVIDAGKEDGFIEFSAKKTVELQGGALIAQEALIDPEDLTISTDYNTNGTNHTFEADNSITLAENVTVSSREINGSDYLSAESIGDSGDLTFLASEINISDGSQILAHADSGFEAGDITFIAKSEVSLFEALLDPVFNDKNKSATINIGDATIKGRDISMTAYASTLRDLTLSKEELDKHSLDELGSMYVENKWNAFLGSLIPGLEVSLISTAKINFNTGADISAKNLNVESEAYTSTGFKGTDTFKEYAGGGTFLGLNSVVSDSHSEIIFNDGVTVNATENVNVNSMAKNTVNFVSTVTSALPANINVSILSAEADTKSKAAVEAGATINAKNLSVTAENTNNYYMESIASSATGAVQANTSILTSDFKSTADAYVNGDVNTTETLTIKSKSINEQNEVHAMGSAGQPAFLGVQKTLINKATEKLAAKKLFSGKGIFAVGAAVVVADSSNVANAYVGNRANINADGDIVISAVAEDNHRIGVIGTASKAKVAVGGAVGVTNYKNEANAFIEDEEDNAGTMEQANVNSSGLLDISSEAKVPSQNDWLDIFDWSDVDFTLPTADNSTSSDWAQDYWDLKTGNLMLSLQEKLSDLADYNLKTFGLDKHLGTTYVNSVGKGTELGLAGAVLVHDYDNKSKSYIGKGAQINQDASFTNANQKVSVKSESTVNDINLGGIFDLKKLFGADGKAAMGGTYQGINYANSAQSWIADGVNVSAKDDVLVKSNAEYNALSIAVAGGKAEKVGIEGAVSFHDVTNVSEAYIEDTATVDSEKDIILDADIKTKSINITGALVKSGNVGVGASVAFNKNKNTARTFIANRENTSHTAGSVNAANNISLDSQLDEDIYAFSVAGASASGSSGSGSSDSDETPEAGSEAAKSAESNGSGSEDAGGSGFGIGLSGSVSINELTNITESYIANAEVNAGNDLLLNANANNFLVAVGGGAVNAETAGLGGAYVQNRLNNTTKSYSQESTLDIANRTSILAETKNKVISVAAGLAGAKKAAVAGSANANLFTNITLASLGDDTTLLNSKFLEIKANNETKLISIAGALSKGDKMGVGLAFDLGIFKNTVSALIGKRAVLDVDGLITIEAKNNDDILPISASLAAAKDGLGASGSATAYFLTNNTNAGIDTDAQLSSTGALSIAAKDTTNIITVAGSIAAGKAGVGASVALMDIEKNVNAFIADDASVDASLISVIADSIDKFIVFAVGFGAGKTAGLAASAPVNLITEKIRAYIGKRTTVNSNSDLTVEATANTELLSVAGALGVGKSAGIGAGADVAVINKDTQAYVDSSAELDAGRNIFVKAFSKEDIVSIAAAAGLASSVGLAGAASVYVVNLITKAFINNNSKVNAQGSVVVSAKDENEVDLIAGTAAFGSVGAGLSAATYIVDKTTDAYIADGAQVNAYAKDSAGTVEVETGVFDISYVADSDEENEIKLEDDISDDRVNDQSATGQRVATAHKQTIQGLSVTALSSDDIESVAAAGAGGTSGAVAGSGAVTIVSNNTSAYVADNAQINQSNTGAGKSQSVIVGAANDFYHMGIAAALSVGGSFGAGPGADVSIIKNNTKAYIGKSADVFAKKDVLVTANSSQDILSVAAALAASGTVSVAGAVSYNSIDNDTYAYVDEDAVVNVDGSMTVAAKDETDIDVIDGGLSIGISGGGVGGAVAVTNIVKDTQAYTAKDVSINAKASSTNSLGINQGLSIEASSKEDLLTIAACGAAGLYAGVAGAVSVNNVSSNTSAYIGENNAVNQLAGAAANQSVNVSALNELDLLSVGGAIGGGAVGIAGGVDIGIIKNDTSAYISKDSNIAAKNVVNIESSSDKNIETYAAAASAGLVGVAGGVSVYSIGTNLSASAKDSLKSDEGDHVNAQSYADQQAQTAGATGVLANYDDQRIKDAGARVSDDQANSGVAAAVNSTVVPAGTSAFTGENVTINAGTDLNIEANEKIDFTSGAGSASGGGVAIGGAVTVLNVDSKVNAFTGTSNNLNANNNIKLKSYDDLDVNLDAITGGAGGLVSLGAAVAIVNADVTNNAFLGENVVIDNANQVELNAESDADIDIDALGANAGSLAVGVVVAEANLSSTTDARVMDGARVGKSADASKSVNELKVIADAANNVDTYTVAASGGIVSGNGAASSSNNTTNVVAAIDNNGQIETNNKVSVEAQAVDTTKAKATGVGIGALNVGVSVAKSKATPTVKAIIGNSNNIRTSELLVEADLNEDSRSEASGSSGALIGISATESEAKTDSTVEASTGSYNSMFLGNRVDVNAKNISKQNAYVDGIVGGIIAAGANKSKAIAISDTKATMGSSATIIAQTVAVNADSSDQTYAEASAGSGGLIAGSAAEAYTDAKSSTSAEIADGAANKYIDVNTVDLDAVHTQKIDSKSDSLGAGVVGASGSITDNRSDSTVTASLGSNLDIKAENLYIDSQNKVHKNTVSGYNVEAAAGGALSGAAGSSYTNIKNNTFINIGNNTDVDLIDDSSNPDAVGYIDDDLTRAAGDLKLNILNEVIAYDKAKLDTGGAISVALAESEIDNSQNNATINLGVGAKLKNDSDIDLAIRNNTNIKTDSNVKTYGGAGAAQGETVSKSNVNNTINLKASSAIVTKSNTTSTSDGNLRLMIGQDSDGNVSNHTVKANTDLYNKTTIPIETKPDADAELYQSHNINIASGAKVETNGDVSLKANKGNRNVKGYGVGKDLYREALAAIGSFVSNLTGGGDLSLDIKSGRSVDSASTTVTVDGKVEVGTENVKKIHINRDGTLDTTNTTEGLTITTSSENVENNIQGRIDEIAKMISALEEKVNTGSTPSGYSNVALYTEKQNIEEEQTGLITSNAYFDEEMRLLDLDNQSNSDQMSDNRHKIDVTNAKEKSDLNTEYSSASDARKLEILNRISEINSEDQALETSNITLQDQIDKNNVTKGEYSTYKSENLTRLGEIDTRIGEINSQLVVDNSGDSDLQKILAKYKAEKAMLEAQLAGLGGSSSSVGIIDIDQEITAKSSNVFIESDSLIGSGELKAPGDTLIEVVNKSINFLRTNKMTIPDEAGGKIFHNDIFVKSNAEINNRNVLFTGANFSNVTTCDNTTAEIKVLNDYVPDTGERAPDIFVAQDIRNRYGKVSITSTHGSVKVNEGVDVTADVIRITAGRDVFIGYKDGFRNIAGDIYAHWKSLSDPKQSGRNDFSTSALPENLIDTAFADDPSVLAGNNIFISGEYLNINGKIQSGIADRVVNLGTDLNSVISQYQTDYNNGLKTESRVNVNTLAETDPSQIAVFYDAEKQRLELADVDILGGYVELYGHIMNTAVGEINVLDGYGTIDVTNNTNYDLEVKGLNTGEGIEGTIKITDTGKSSAFKSSIPLVTVIKRLDGTVYEFNNDATGTLELDNLNIANAADSLAGRSFEYKPLENQYYTWTQRDVEEYVEKRKKTRDRWIRVFTTDTDYSYGGYERGASSYGTPVGSAVLRQVDLGGATYAYDNTSYLETLKGWHDEDGWHSDFDYGVHDRSHMHQEKDMKLTNYHTHNVKAFNPIDINFIGSDTGMIDVVSDKGNILINGAVKNILGTTTLDATNGKILQGTDNYAEITTQYLDLYAAQGIGTSSDGHLKVNLVNGGDLTATSTGDINIKAVRGDLTYVNVHTNSNVSLIADTNIAGLNSSSLITGDLIEIESQHGAVGANGAAVRVNSAANENGGLSVKAASDIYLDETTGDLYLVAAESTGGNATIKVEDGSMIDNNKVETEDTRTKAQMLSLWEELQLTGDDAKASAQSTVDSYERLQKYEYNKYWRYRDDQTDPNAYDQNHEVKLSQAEVDHYKNTYSWSDTQISEYETKMTNEYHELHNVYGIKGDVYDSGLEFNVVEGSDKWNELTVGSSWTNEELSNSLSVGLVKETSDTEIRIEDSNISANNVILSVAKKDITKFASVGHDHPTTVIIYASDLRTNKPWSDLDESIPAEKAILDKIFLLMSAEKKDIVSESADHIEIQVREDIDVTATGNINASASGNIYLGSENDLNIISVATSNDVRIKTAGAIFNAATAGPAIAANSLILEAGRGDLGTAAKEMLVETNELTARSGNDMYLKENTGNMNISKIYAVGKANLRTDASIVDAHNTGDVNIRAESLHVDVTGDMGTIDNMIEVGLDRSGEFTADMPNGDIYINSPKHAFTTGDVNLGTGNLSVISNDDIVINSENGGVQAHNGTVYLASEKSIIDGDENTDAGIQAQYIDLIARNGDVGQKGNVLEVDTEAHNSYVKIGSQNNIYVEETIGNLLVKELKSIDGNIELEAKDGVLTVEEADAFADMQLKALTDVEIKKVKANGNVKVVAANGNINGQAGVGANISGDTIELEAANGSIGSKANALDVDCKVDALAANDIVLNEVHEDMQIGLIESTAGDVVLTANDGSIVDADIDELTDIKANNITINVSGTIGESDNALEIEAYDAGLINALAGSDINITEDGDMNIGFIESLFADVKLKANAIFDGLNNLASNIKAKDIDLTTTATDIGASDNYLDLDVSNEITAVAQRSIYLREATGDMDVKSVTSNTADVNLTTDANLNVGYIKAIAGKVTAWAKENISDSLNNNDSNIDAINIDLTADNGYVGAKDNFFDIDSSNAVEGLVDATAEKGIFLRETNGNMNIGSLEVRNGDLGIDVEGDIMLGSLNARNGDVYARAKGSILDRDNTNQSNINTINAELIATEGSIGQKNNLIDTNIESRIDALANKDITINELNGGLKLGKIRSKNGDFVLRSNGDITNDLVPNQTNIKAGIIDIKTSKGDFGKAYDMVTMDSRKKVNVESAGGIFIREVEGDLFSDYLYASTGKTEVKVDNGNISIKDIYSFGDVKIMIPNDAFDSTRAVDFDFSWQHSFVKEKEIRMARLNRVFAMPKKAFVFNMQPMNFLANMYPLASADIDLGIKAEKEESIAKKPINELESKADKVVVKTKIAEIVTKVKDVVKPKLKSKTIVVEPTVAPVSPTAVKPVVTTIKPQINQMPTLPIMQAPMFRPMMQRPVVLFYHELADEENSSSVDQGLYEHLEKKN